MRKKIAYPHPPRTPHTLSLLILLMLIAAFSLPTSISGELSRGVTLYGWAITITLLSLAIITNWKVSLISMSAGLLFSSLVFLFTIKSNLNETSPGALLPLISFLLATSFHPKPRPGKRENIFLLSLCFILFLSIMPLLSHWAYIFLENYYTYGWEGIIPSMLERRKPVSVFSSHSIAAFFYFLIFLISIELAAQRQKKLWVLFGLIFFSLLIFLKSTSGYMLLLLGLLAGPMIYFHHKGTKLKAAAFTVLITITILALIFNIESFMLALGKNNEYSGFFIRYSDHGVLTKTFQEIIKNPFLGQGISYSENFYYTDSGYILITLRAGIIGLLAWYYIFLMWAWRLNASKAFRVFFIVSILGFEIGYPVLQNWRLLMFMPFLSALLRDEKKTTLTANT